MEEMKDNPLVEDNSIEKDQVTTNAIAPELIEALHNPNPQIQLDATRKLRKQLSRDSIEEVIKAGVVPRFVEFIQNGNLLTLQFEAAWVLTNIAAGTSAQTLTVIQSGAVPVLIHALSSEYRRVQEQAVWALANIAGDSPEFRDLLLDSGTLQPLLDLLDPNVELPISMTRNLVWAVKNLCRGKGPPPVFAKVTPCLPVLARLLHHNDPDVLTDSCCAFTYLSDGLNGIERIEAVINAGVCPRIVELLMHDHPEVVYAALRVVGNIATGNDQQTETVILCSALPRLKLLCTPSYFTEHEALAPREKCIRKEAVWTISNITAGNQQQIQSVIDADVFPLIIETLSDTELIRKEALWAVSNAIASGTDDQIRYLLDRGCIPPICELLRVIDKQIVALALGTLRNILRLGETSASTYGFNIYALGVEECSGLEKIEFVQWQDNGDLYEKSSYIIDRYFGGSSVL